MKHPVPITCAATRRAAGTPWVTANRQAWASTTPAPWTQTDGEKTAGGPPWGILSSTSTLPAKAMTTRGPSGPPARTVATHGSPSQTSPTSGKTECSLPSLPLLN